MHIINNWEQNVTFKITGQGNSANVLWLNIKRNTVKYNICSFRKQYTAYNIISLSKVWIIHYRQTSVACQSQETIF